MVERFANVVYWSACTVAFLAASLAVFGAIFAPEQDKLFWGAFLGITTILVWLGGRAVRYVLTGR